MLNLEIHSPKKGKRCVRSPPLSPKAARKKDSPSLETREKERKANRYFFKSSGPQGRCTEADAMFQNEPGNHTFSPDKHPEKKPPACPPGGILPLHTVYNAQGNFKIYYRSKPV
jgi:hypothetical protein